MPLRICCIEPSAALRKKIVRLIEGRGWQVDACASLDDAEARISLQRPDVVTSPATLPDGDHRRIIGRLRHIAGMECTPVVLLTSARSRGHLEGALEAGITEVFREDGLDDLLAYLDTLAAHTPPPLAGRQALILDDDPFFGLYLGALLDHLGIISRHVTSAVDALASAQQTPYDLIVSDLVLAGGESGIRFIRDLRHSEGRSASTPVIAVSGFQDDARRLEALRAGAATFLDKPVNEPELRFHVERLLSQSAPLSAVPLSPAIDLSEREQLICSLVALGNSDKTIASQLGISYWTVRTHLGRIFRKCGVGNRVELGNVLRQRGDGPPPPATAPWPELAAHVFDTISHGLLVTDDHGTIMAVNEALIRITGYSRDELLGQTPRLWRSDRQDASFYQQMQQALTAQGRWSGKLWNRHKNGRHYFARLDLHRLPVPSPGGATRLGVLTDITAAHHRNEQMRFQALHDPLTGLGNRILLEERARLELARAERSGSRLACVFIDLDDFKPINDRHGHDAGDRVLCAVADRLRVVFRSIDSLIRFGGDEFVAIIPDLPDRAAAVRLGLRTLEAFHAPVFVGEQAHPVSASIGISLYPDDAPDFSRLLALADAAMYRAKSQPGNHLCFHEDALDQAADERKQQGIRLQQALGAGEFALWLQPKVDLANHRIIGAEALLRWHCPQRGVLTPAEFLPLAKQSGLIVPLSDWILREGCRLLQRFHARGHTGFTLALNVSPRQIAREEFIDEVGAALADSGAPAHALQIEIAEQAFQFAPAQIGDTTCRLAEAGVRVALDNFGSGRSSLAELARARFDTVKVDRDCIHRLHDDRTHATFARAAAQMAGGLAMTMVAGGVEDDRQAALLRDIGCHHAQGFLFGKPMPPDSLLALLDEDQRRAPGLPE